MEEKKEVLNYCLNFERIMNTDFLEGDNLSIRLVKIYKDFIFKVDINNLEDLKEVKELDQIMGKYIDDYTFRKKLQIEMRSLKIRKNPSDIIRAIVEGLIEIFHKYEIDATRKIYISRWI